MYADAVIRGSGSRIFIRSAIEMELNYFDHADIYGNGQCEDDFAKQSAMTPSMREQLILQSKCGNTGWNV